MTFKKHPQNSPKIPFLLAPDNLSPSAKKPPPHKPEWQHRFPQKPVTQSQPVGKTRDRVRRQKTQLRIKGGFSCLFFNNFVRQMKRRDSEKDVQF
jgi:hypothetical protein